MTNVIRPSDGVPVILGGWLGLMSLALWFLTHLHEKLCHLMHALCPVISHPGHQARDGQCYLST